MALALLAGSFPVAAQFCPVPNGEIQYHSRMVKAGELDATFENVDKINQNYYYQLEVDPASLGKESNEGVPTYVLSAERDYATGKIYLTAQPVTDATLTHTLWKITVTDRAANGRVYKYVNLETGYELSFDHGTPQMMIVKLKILSKYMLTSIIKQTLSLRCGLLAKVMLGEIMEIVQQRVWLNNR